MIIFLKKVVSVMVVLGMVFVGNSLTVLAAVGNIGGIVDGPDAVVTPADAKDLNIIHLSGDRYLLTYASNYCYSATVDITPSGTIGPLIDVVLTSGVGNPYGCVRPKSIALDSNSAATVYTMRNSVPYLSTVNIDENGLISRVEDYVLPNGSLAHGYDPDITNVSGNTYAIFFGNNDFQPAVRVMSISATGTISGTSGSYGVLASADTGFDGGRIEHLNGDVFVTYNDGGSNLYLRAVSVTAAGEISSLDSTLLVADYDGQNAFGDIVTVPGGQYFAVNFYDTAATPDSTVIRTFGVDSGGQISSSNVSNVTVDASSLYSSEIEDSGHDIEYIGENVYVTAYEGHETDNNILYLKLYEINDSGLITQGVLSEASFSAVDLSTVGVDGVGHPDLLSVGGDNYVVASTADVSDTLDGTLTTFLIEASSTDIPEFKTYLYLIVLFFGFWMVNDRFGMPVKVFSRK